MRKIRTKMIHLTLWGLLILSLVQSVDILSNSDSSFDKIQGKFTIFLDVTKWNMELNINFGTDFSLSFILSDLSTIERGTFFDNLSSLTIEFSTEILSDYWSFLGIKPTGNLYIIMIGTITFDRERYRGENKKEIPFKRMIIQEMINNNPGISLRELQRMTGFGMGGIQHHIYQLESSVIESLKLGRCKHFFISAKGFTTQEKILYSLNRNQNIKNIIESVQLAQKGCSQKDLTLYTGNSKYLICYYVKILKNHGIIEDTNRILRLSDIYNQLLQFKD